MVSSVSCGIMGISLYSGSPLYLSLVIVFFKEFLTSVNRLQNAELLLPHCLSTLTTSLSSASCLLPSISGDSVVPEPRLQLHHHIFHCLRPEVDSRQKYLREHQPHCGQYLLKLSVASGRAAADFYLLLRWKSCNLRWSLSVGQQISGRPGIYTD